MSEHIRGSYDDALYKSTYTGTVLYFISGNGKYLMVIYWITGRV